MDTGSGEDPQAVAERSTAAMWAGDQASQGLGIRLSDLGPGRAVATMSVTAGMINGHAIAHGGYVFLLADTAFAFACNSYGEATVAQAAQIAFLAPVQADDVLVATAQERTRAGRSGVYDVTVRRSTGEVVAEFRGHSRGLGRPLVGD